MYFGTNKPSYTHSCRNCVGSLDVYDRCVARSSGRRQTEGYDRRRNTPQTSAVDLCVDTGLRLLSIFSMITLSPVGPNPNKHSNAIDHVQALLFVSDVFRVFRLCVCVLPYPFPSARGVSLCSKNFCRNGEEGPPVPSCISASAVTSNSVPIRLLCLYAQRSERTHRPSGSSTPLASAPDPFELVAGELASLSDGIKSLVGTEHPVLNAAAKYFFELDGGKKIRPAMVRATKGHQKKGERKGCACMLKKIWKKFLRKM